MRADIEVVDDPGLMTDGGDPQLDRAIAHLVKSSREGALSVVVHLQRGIDQSKMVMIDYEKQKGILETGRVICPLLLFQSLNEWRVLAVHEGVRKQYILSKIRSVEPTAKTFQKPPVQESLEMFSASWNAWIGGGPEHEVKIELSKELAGKMPHRYFTENQDLVSSDDGRAILRVRVNSLVEVAMWIVSTAGARALSPKALVDLVVFIIARWEGSHGFLNLFSFFEITCSS